MEKKWNYNNPKHTTSSVKHGGGVVMAWACMNVSGTGPLNLNDYLMYDGSSRMNLERVQNHLGYQYSRKCHQTHQKTLHLHQDNDPKHPASSVKEFIRAKKWKVLDYPSQSPDLNLIDMNFTS